MGLTSNTGPYNAAADVFGVDNPVMSAIPRLKYEFTVELTLNESIPLIDESYGRQFVFDRVQTVNLPDMQHNVVRVNQYNRPRYVPTKLEVTPATIVFYDTKDSQFQYLLQAYSRHYFHGHNVDDRTMMSYDTVAPSFDGTFGTKAVPTSQKFFFERIRILTRDTAQNGRIITMYNCMITQVNSDTLTYSDSSPQVWTVVFQPEHMNIESSGAGTNGQTSGTNGTQPYDLARSEAAGVLVDSSGNVLRDSTGNTIAFGSVSTTRTTSTSPGTTRIVDANGNQVLDSNGNPVQLNVPY